MLSRNSASNNRDSNSSAAAAPLIGGDDALFRAPFLRPTLDNNMPVNSEMHLRLTLNETGGGGGGTCSSSSCLSCFSRSGNNDDNENDDGNNGLYSASSKSVLSNEESLLSMGGGADRPSSLHQSRSSGGADGAGGRLLPSSSGGGSSRNRSAQQSSSRCFSCPSYLRKCSNVSVLLLLLSSSLLLVLSLIVKPVVTYYLNAGIKDEIVVSSEDSPSYDAWVTNTGPDNADVEVQYKVYVFHISNPSDVLAGLDVPELVQLGPYIYSEYFLKHEINFSEDGTEVSYFTRWWFVFDAESSYPLNDVQDTALQSNLVLMGARQLLAGYGPLLNEYVPGLIANSTKIPDSIKENILEQIEGVDLSALALKAVQCYVGGEDYVKTLALGPFHVKNVRDLYFGYDNDETLVALKNLVEMISPTAAATFSTYAPGITVNYTSVQDNLLHDGPTVVKTGKNDVSELGLFVRYANMTRMYVCPDSTALCKGVDPRPWNATNGETAACWQYQAEWSDEQAQCHGWRPMFATDEANAIIGTDASQTGIFPMGDYVQVFIDDLYRSSNLIFVKEMDDWHGVKLRRYGIDPEDMKSAEQKASQADFYQFGLYGMENMTTAAGFPLFATKPHFLDGDPALAKGVRGMNPAVDEHDTFVDFEPLTGVTFRASKRLQVNTIVEDWKLPIFNLGLGPLELAELKKKSPELYNVLECLSVPSSWSAMPAQTFVPYSWADETVEYSAQDAEDFKTQVYGTQDLADSAAIYLAIGAGTTFLCAIWGIAYANIIKREERKEIELVNEGRGGAFAAAAGKAQSVRF